MREHLLGGVEVGDDAIANRPDGPQPIGRASEHAARVFADCFDRAGGGVEGNQRRLVDDDAFAEGVDAGIRGAQVDSEVAAKSCEGHDAAQMGKTYSWSGAGR